MKKHLVILFTIVLVTLCLNGCGNKDKEKVTTTVSLEQENKENSIRIINKLKAAQKGDVVEFCRDTYNYKRWGFEDEDMRYLLSWKVLHRKKNKLLLLLDKASMPAYYYEPLHKQINNEDDELSRDISVDTIEAYSSKDARYFFNDGIFQLPILDNGPLGIKNTWIDWAVVDKRYKYKDNTYLFFLGEDNANKYCTKEDLLLRSKDNNNMKYEWWIDWTEYIDKEGNIKSIDCDDEDEINNKRKAIRPALWVDTSVEIDDSDVPYLD